MKIKLLRHATFILEINGQRILVDPMFSPQGKMEPVKNSPDQMPNPLVELPVAISEVEKLIGDIDALLLTHTHRDHFDDKAIEILPRDLQVFCQPSDEGKLKKLGFTKVTVICKEFSWRNIEIIRTLGKHGSGLTGKLMGPVSGFVLKSPGEATLYVTGDTIMCPAVEKALADFTPDIIIAYAGAAQLKRKNYITMNEEDILQLCEKAPRARVIVVHMEAFNHCLLTREHLKSILDVANLSHRVLIPANGESLQLN